MSTLHHTSSVVGLSSIFEPLGKSMQTRVNGANVELQRAR
jgi:hypothetical protein